MLHFVFAENAVVTPLARKAALRTHQAFRPKTRQAYDAMFKVFVAFCRVAGVIISDVNVEIVMSFLECMVQNHCSCAVLENYISIKAYDAMFQSVCRLLHSVLGSSYQMLNVEIVMVQNHSHF